MFLTIGIAGAARGQYFLALLLIPATIVLARGLDPRPAVKVDEAGVTFGGLFKVVAFGDVVVTWADIDSVSPVERAHKPLRIGKLDVNPAFQNRQLDRRLGASFTVRTTSGREFKVRDVSASADLNALAELIRGGTSTAR